jgi:endonuclease V-like protein UPF0215 family
MVRGRGYVTPQDVKSIGMDVLRHRIIVTYEDSEGLEGDIAHHFPGDEERLAAYRNLGNRVPVQLKGGGEVFIRTAGLSHEDAAQILRDFTRDGKIPEPVRVARLVARAAMRWNRDAGILP